MDTKMMCFECRGEVISPSFLDLFSRTGSHLHMHGILIWTRNQKTLSRFLMAVKTIYLWLPLWNIYVLQWYLNKLGCIVVRNTCSLF